MTRIPFFSQSFLSGFCLSYLLISSLPAHAAINTNPDTYPLFTDFNQDGAEDLLLADPTAGLRVFRNAADPSQRFALIEQIGDINPFKNINLNGDYRISLANLDGDNKPELIVGTNNGTIRMFSDLSGTGFGELSSHSMSDIDVGFNASVAFLDIDNDGDQDAIFGSSNAKITFYENVGTANIPQFIERANERNPFALLDVGGSLDITSLNLVPRFADIDNDSDKDLVLGTSANGLILIENTGINGQNRFQTQLKVKNIATPTTADIDGDGLLDLFIGRQAGQLTAARNMGTPQQTDFHQQYGADDLLGSFTNTNTRKSHPAFVDIDGNGTLDLFLGNNTGVLEFYKNIGTSTVAQMSLISGTENPLDSIDVGFNAHPVFKDLDADGDFDVLIGNDAGKLQYFLNEGTRNVANFVLQIDNNNPFNGLDFGTTGVAPDLIDIDNDADLDLFVGLSDGTMQFSENTGTANTPLFSTSNGSSTDTNISLTADSAPSLADLNNDGLIDMVIGTDTGIIWYKNIGTVNAANFLPQIGNDNVFANYQPSGTLFRPSVADIDGDGLLDITIGKNDGTLDFLRNTSTFVANATTNVPTFIEEVGNQNPINVAGSAIDVGFNSAPNFADLDGDGDLDLLVAESTGLINYFENIGTSNTPIFIAHSNSTSIFGGIQTGDTAAPLLSDIDRDNDLDLILGNSSDSLDFIENVGDVNNPIFLTLEQHDFGRESAPVFADLTGDNLPELIIGSSDGNIFYFKNIGTPNNPKLAFQTSAANPFNQFNIPQAKLSFIDDDKDGDLDVYAGQRDGTIIYLRNIGNATNPVFSQEVTHRLDSFDFGFNVAPMIADMDNDGDVDLIIGSSTGKLEYYQNNANIFSLQATVLGSFIGGADTVPTLVDIDNDNDLDIIVGNATGAFDILLNNGLAPTNSSPLFVQQAAPHSLSNITIVSGNSSPTFADFNGNGFKSLVSGNRDGVLSFFQNVNSQFSPNAFFSPPRLLAPFSGLPPIPVGNNVPSGADLNGNGLIELIIGHSDGTLTLLEDSNGTYNSGPLNFNNTPPPEPDPIDTMTGNFIANLSVSAEAMPHFADLDADGDFDLIIGDANGILNYFDNIGTASNANFVRRPQPQLNIKPNPFAALTLGGKLAPTFADIEGDGDIDILVGSEQGGLLLFEKLIGNAPPYAITALSDFEGSSTLTDLGIDLGRLDTFNAVQLSALTPEQLAAFDAQALILLPPEAFANLSSEQVASFSQQALSGLKPEQLAQLPSSSLAGFQANNIGLLPPPTINVLSSENIAALDSDALKQANGRDLLRLLTNLDPNVVRPSDVQNLLPEGWKIDLSNGNLSVPAGTPLSLRAQAAPPALPERVKLPENRPDLNSRFGLGGNAQGNSLLEDMNAGLDAAGFGNVNFTQNDQGILFDEGLGLSFIIDSENLEQGEANLPEGVDTNAQGRFFITTANQQKIPLIPAPKDPIGLQAVLEKQFGEVSIRFNDGGDVIILFPAVTNANTATRAESGDTMVVVSFDPVTETSSDNIDTGFDVSEEGDLQITYADNSTQTFYFSIAVPSEFSATAIAIGATSVSFVGDGTAIASISSVSYTITPIGVQSRLLNDGEVVTTRFNVNDAGSIEYIVEDGGYEIITEITVVVR